jgi:branched-chain amino acid aminotransferase
VNRDSVVHLDGRWLPANEARISIFDRGFLFGDAVFDTARLFGGRFFRLAAHLERLVGGAARLRIPVPPVPEMEALARELVARNDVVDGSLRITVTRGSTRPPPGAVPPPTFLMTLEPLPSNWRERASLGWSLITSRTRHPTPDPNVIGLKTPGRIHGILARLEAEAAGAHDALMLSPANQIVEGPSWNLFWFKAGQLRTPGLELGALDGVTRSAVIELAAREGLEVACGAWPRDELDDADEIFATMSSLGLVRINRLDGRPLPDLSPVWQRLSAAYWQLVQRETGVA